MSDAQPLADLLAAAFMDDPVSRWIFPNNEDRRRLHPAFFRIYVCHVIRNGTIYIADEYSAAALWLPVGASDPPEEMAVPAEFGSAVGPFSAARLSVLAELTTRSHPCQTAHHYLAFIGVQSEHRGSGLGTVLLQHQLDRLDSHGVPAYLEASSPRNANLYARLGFDSLGHLELPDGPPLQRMWREPRPV